MIPAYGMTAAAAVFERDPEAPGGAFVAGSSARDYATSELLARTGGEILTAQSRPAGEPAIRAAA
jgi:hypothetical protein